MTKNSFVAFIPSTQNENYRVAFGNCGTGHNVQFIELEYTDGGILIHYHTYKCEEYKEISKQKYLEFQKGSPNFFSLFYGTAILTNLLNAFGSYGCDYLHKPDCDCNACSILPNNLYILKDNAITGFKSYFEKI